MEVIDLSGLASVAGLGLGLGLAAVTASAQLATGPLRLTSMVPSGDNVPASRQLLFQFDRPVVPIGRMERRPDELPIEIEPALACDWRWIDPSALACQLGDDTAMRMPWGRSSTPAGRSFAAGDSTSAPSGFKNGDPARTTECL